MASYPKVTSVLEQFLSALDNRNWQAVTTLAMQLAQEAHLLYIDKVRLEYRAATAGERQVDYELLQACKMALLDGTKYKLSDVVRHKLNDTIDRAERFVEDGTADHVVITMADGKKIKLIAQLMED